MLQLAFIISYSYCICFTFALTTTGPSGEGEVLIQRFARPEQHEGGRKKTANCLSCEAVPPFPHLVSLHSHSGRKLSPTAPLRATHKHTPLPIINSLLCCFCVAVNEERPFICRWLFSSHSVSCSLERKGKRYQRGNKSSSKT